MEEVLTVVRLGKILDKVFFPIFLIVIRI